nr:MAG TPA_asm: hypothetical protein [Caudoviricetes sp.]
MQRIRLRVVKSIPFQTLRGSDRHGKGRKKHPGGA